VQQIEKISRKVQTSREYYADAFIGWILKRRKLYCYLKAKPHSRNDSYRTIAEGRRRKGCCPEQQRRKKQENTLAAEEKAEEEKT